MNKFFILGLPRSRTSWLANFFTYDKSYCYHEGLLRYLTADNFGQDKQLSNFDYIGDSSSGLVFIIDDLIKKFPGAKIVLIERNSEDVIKSLSKMFINYGLQDFHAMVAELDKKLDYIKQAYNPVIIKFEDLNDIEKIKKLWEFCVSTIEFNTTRYKILNTLKIEPEINKYMGGIKTWQSRQ